MVQILICARNDELEKVEDEEGKKVEYCRVEFHRVDLKGEEDEKIEVERECLPSFLCRGATGSMFKLGPFVYVVGGLMQRIDDDDDEEAPHIPSGRQNLYYRGGSQIDIREEGGGVWRDAPIPINSYMPVCAQCNWDGGKIYSFGTVLEIVEVLDPSVAAWKVLPPPPSDILGSAVSTPVVADPSRRRFLVHLSRSRGLYAFYPEDCRWESLYLDQVCLWGEVVAVVDDLLFLYDFEFPSLFWVFDFATGTWLDVVWAQTPNNRLLPFFPSFPFDALFPLAPHTLCLAGFTLDSFLRPSVDINFLKFTFSRCPTRPATLILTPLAFPSHQLSNTYKVVNFLPI